MRNFIILLFIFSPFITQGIEFYSGSKKFSVQSISGQLSKRYKTDFTIATVVVVSTFKTDLYDQQWNFLSKLDAEKWQLIYVSSLVHNNNESGYKTTSDVAIKLLKSNEFSVLIYSPSGDVLVDSDIPITADNIKNLLQKYHPNHNIS
ncbi:hypothetical protein [Algibacillus agarilyticus]|uniref:hypothetical protein n=1 Tax=Algibacillus agarilyticus TaxID=2234133 RepID=UPI000DD012CC|nr:hypothetical protein [Algibacillus agarilyticus]